MSMASNSSNVCGLLIKAFNFKKPLPKKKSGGDKSVKWWVDNITIARNHKIRNGAGDGMVEYIIYSITYQTITECSASGSLVKSDFVRVIINQVEMPPTLRQGTNLLIKRSLLPNYSAEPTSNGWVLLSFLTNKYVNIIMRHRDGNIYKFFLKITIFQNLPKHYDY